MKKAMLFMAASALAVSASAQTIYEAANLIDSDLNGTARYVGMGGAMNALGGDVSVIRSNPAGIGVYRSNDLVFSFGTNTASTSFDLDGNKYRKTSFSFDNAAFVYAVDMGRKRPVRFLNFAFNYNKRRNFNRKWSGAWADGTTQTDLIADMATNGINWDGQPGYDPEQFEEDIAFVTDNPYVGWLPIMAYNAWLINPEMDGADNFDGFWSGYMPADSFDHYYEVNESGWINDYDFNISMNLYDRVYLGMTLTAIDVKYQKSSLYTEEIYYGIDYRGGYDLTNTYSTSGSGLGFSLGIIARLHDNLRLGFSFSTPTIYWLTDYQESSLAYGVDVDGVDGRERMHGTISPYDEYGSFMGYQYSYRVRAPWKVNLSLGATLINRLALGAEWEFQNAAKTSIMYDDGVLIDVLNDGYFAGDGSLIGGIKQSFKKQNTFKIGGEFRVTPSFAVRAGFNYVTSFMDEGAFKYMESSSARTDTEYENAHDRWSVAAGLGYSKNHFYIDLAYQFMKYDSDFYPYDNTSIAPLLLGNREHQALMSVGFRF